MKKMLIGLTSIFFGCLIFIDSSYAKVRNYTFEYTVINHSGSPLKATKIDNNSRVSSTVHYSPSGIIASGQTMKITGTMAVDGPIIKEDYFSTPIATVTKLTFSLTEGTQKTLLTVYLKPTYLRGIISPTHSVCAGYSFVTTGTTVDIIKNPARNDCAKMYGPNNGGSEI